MRYLFLLFLYSLIAISCAAQTRYSTYRTFERGAIYNLVIQLPTADLYFDMTRVQHEIDQHDWSIAGKTPAEVSKLKTWLNRYKGVGLVVTPAMLKDHTSTDYPSIKLLSEYVSGIMLQRLLQGRVYKLGLKFLAAQPIEFSQVVLTENPFVARYNFYLNGENKPFLVTQGIGTRSEAELDEVPGDIEVNLDDDIEVNLDDIDSETSSKFSRIFSFDYKSIMVGHSMGGITIQGDTVLYSWLERPQFMGGSVKLEEFLTSRVKFPESAINAGIYGALVEVAATFMIDGTVRDIVISEGDPRFYDEAMRLMQESSKMWEAGVIQVGKKGNVRCSTELLLRRPSR